MNLHAHFRVANLRHGIDKFPAFPKTSLPYLNWLKGEKRGAVRKADFAKAQRKSLETYLLQLIRATVSLASYVIGNDADETCGRCLDPAPIVCASSSRSQPCRLRWQREVGTKASRDTL